MLCFVAPYQRVDPPHRLYCLLSTRTVEATTKVLILEVVAILTALIAALAMVIVVKVKTRIIKQL